MKAYKVQAPRTLGRVPEGFILQVASNNTAGPQGKDIERALRAAGFTDFSSLQYSAPGNWKISAM